MKNRTPLFLIFITVFIDLLGFGILIPILPTFATKELHVNETAIGIAIAVYSFVQLFFNPILGKLSDKYGRKPLIVISLLLNAFGYVIFAFTHTYLVLIISRIVGGIGGSSIGVAQAYIADVTTKENRAKGMGLIGAAFGLGFVFGPMFGGILSKFGYELTGFASASFSFLACLVSMLLLPESHHGRDREMKIGKKLLDIAAMKKVFRNNELAILIIVAFTLTFSVANIYGTFALLGYKVYNLSDLQNGYLFGIIGLVSALVQGGLLNIISKYLNNKELIIIGTALMMIGMAAVPYGGNITGLIILTIIFSTGVALLQPTFLSLISKVASDKEQGITLGINQSFSAFGRVLGPLWGGFAFQYLGPEFPFFTGSLFALFILITGIAYLPKKIAILGES